MAGEETACCMTLVVLIGIAVLIWIMIKGAKFLGYIGQWRTGSALKHMSREGIIIHQDQQYESASQRRVRTEHESSSRETPVDKLTGSWAGARFCPFCGTVLISGASYCQKCGKKLH